MEDTTTGLEGNIGLGTSAPADATQTPQAAPAQAPAATDAAQQAPAMNPQEEIGFHKGALNTLIAERSELVKMVGNVDAIMQAHINRLKELGVDVTSNNQEQPAQ